MEYSVMKEQLKEVFTTEDINKNNCLVNDVTINVDNDLFLATGRHSNNSI